jgi:hypothetical protein
MQPDEAAQVERLECESCARSGAVGKACIVGVSQHKTGEREKEIHRQMRVPQGVVGHVGRGDLHYMKQQHTEGSRAAQSVQNLEM